MATKEIPEPEGYRNYPGFVKSNPKNNDSYVEKFKGDPWYPAIKQAHEELKALDPGYNIAQIKEKFGELRYYFFLSEAASGDEGLRRKMDEVVYRAEAWVEGYERARSDASGRTTTGTSYLDEEGER